MLIEERIRFLGFFVLKFSKNETMLVLFVEETLVALSATLLLRLHNQFGLRASEHLLSRFLKMGGGVVFRSFSYSN